MVGPILPRLSGHIAVNGLAQVASSSYKVKYSIQPFRRLQGLVPCGHDVLL